MKRFLIVLLSLTLLTLVMGCSSKEEGKMDNTDVVSKGESSDTEGETDIREDVDIEEDGEVIVILNGVERTREDGWVDLAEDRELILVDITIKNNTGQVYEFNANGVNLIINGLNVYRIMVTGDKEDMPYEYMEPGDEVRGIVPFEVFVGTEYENIIYRDNIYEEIELK